MMFKFKKLSRINILKIQNYLDITIFINTSTKFINFKSEYESSPELFFDCFHGLYNRKKIPDLSYKMYILVLYFML